MISVTPPVFTELGGGRREFLEFTPWGEGERERATGQTRLGGNPIRGLLASRKQIMFIVGAALAFENELNLLKEL